MALARLDREIVPTKDDANSAFNAFALALCDEKMFAHIDRYLGGKRELPNTRFVRFIEIVEEELQIEKAQEPESYQNLKAIPSKKWRLIKDHLLSLRQSNLTVFQIRMARVLSKLAAELEQHQDHLNMDSQQKYAPAYLDLERLAQYFDVCFSVLCGDVVACVRSDYGFFPALERRECGFIPEQERDNVFRYLCERNIISSVKDPKKNGYKFNINSLPNIQKMLQQIQHHDVVNQFILINW